MSEDKAGKATALINFRRLYGSWPEWFGELDGGGVVYVRIRQGQVWIGTGDTEDAASDNAELVKEDAREYFGVTEVVEALTELREKHYYFVPPNKRSEYV